KSVAEMRAAIEAKIGTFNIESAEEMTILDGVAREMGTRVKVAVRVNPDVDPETHPYISTGLKQNKFGVGMAEARTLLGRASKMGGLEVVGVDLDIGSPMTKTAPFTDAIARLVSLIPVLAGDGIKIEHIDVGGGL